MTRLLVRMMVLVMLGTSGLSPSLAVAQDTQLGVNTDDSVKTVLARQVGKRVTLVLQAGPEMTGKVVIVGDAVVHLAELAGREFFDAVVPLDRIVAVVVRARGR